jgi:hypothetical protein
MQVTNYVACGLSRQVLYRNLNQWAALSDLDFKTDFPYLCDGKRR